MAAQGRMGPRTRVKRSSSEDNPKDSKEDKALIRAGTWVREESDVSNTVELVRPRIGSAQFSNENVSNISSRNSSSAERETTVVSNSHVSSKKTEENPSEVGDSQRATTAQNSNTEDSESEAETEDESGASNADDKAGKASSKDPAKQDTTTATWKVTPKVVKSRSQASKPKEIYGNRSQSRGENRNRSQDSELEMSQAMSPEPTTVDVRKAGQQHTGRNRSRTLEGIASNFLERVDRAENENKKLMRDNERLMGNMKFASEHEQELMAQNDSLRTDNNDLRDRLHNALENNDALRRRVSDLEQDIQQKQGSLENKNKEMQIKIDELRVVSSREKLQLQEQIGELQQQHNTKIKELRDNSSAEKSRFEDQLRNVEELGAAKRDELKVLQADRKALQDQVKSLQFSRERLVREVNDRDSEREESLQALRTELERFQNRFSILKDDHDEEVKRNAHLEKQVIEQNKEKAESLEMLDELRAENQRVREARRQADCSLSDLRRELLQLQQELTLKQDQMVNLNEKLSEATVKADSGEENRSTLDSLVQEKQSHIDDLKQELWELRNANRNYVKEIERLEQVKSGDSVQDAKYEDMSTAHKKLLEENKHLRTMIAHKSMAETNTQAENTDLKEKLEKLSRKLDISTERVRKLEQWMDEIYSNEEFQGALRDDVSTTLSTASLPNIALAETLRLPATGRKSVPTGKYFRPKKAF